MKYLSSILSFAVFILFCLGIIFSVLFPGITWLGLGSWTLAAVFLMIVLGMEKEKVLRFLTKKSTRYGANLALIVFLVFGILIFINILAKEFNWKKDITRNASNSISPQTEKVLKDLKQSVKITYFNRPQEREKAERLFKNYTYLSKKVKFEIVDPNRQPTLTKSMGVQKFDTVVLSLEGENPRTVKLEGISEEKLTNGFIKLLKTKSQNIYFTVGHGERSLEEAAANGENYGLIKKELEKESYTVKELNLFSTGKVPEDADVLVLAGPRTAFFPKELEILSAWIKAGGHAWLAFDLDIRESGLAPGSRQLAALVKEFGVEVGNQMLVDPTSKAANVEPQVLMGFAAAKQHPITKDFPTSSMGLVANFLFPLTTRFTLLEAKDAPYQTTILAKTTASAWAESDWNSLRKGVVHFDAGKDYRGEMNLALAIEEKNPKKTPYRVTLFASSAFGINGLLRFAGNRDLFLNSIAWLTNDESTISIRAKNVDEAGDRIDLNQNWMTLVAILVVIVIPVFIIGVGIAVWFRRRGK